MTIEVSDAKTPTALAANPAFTGTYAALAGATFTGGVLLPNAKIGIGTSDPETYRLKVIGVADRGSAYFVSTLTNVSNIDGALVETDTVASTNGTYDLYGISSQITEQVISAGVTDLGGRIAITGDAYAVGAGFAGTLANQMGLRGRAGLTSTVDATAVVTNAYGGYFHIRNEKAGTTIVNAFGIYINNNEITGTITNRWDVYAASTLAKSYFAGTVGIGVTPLTKLHILAGTNSAADLEAVRLQNNGENGTEVRFHNAFGPLAGITATKMGGGGLADDGAVSILTATNAVLAERLRIDSTGVTVEGAFDHNGTTAGFFGTAPVTKPTGVAVTAAGIHASLVTLGLIAA